MKLFLKYNIITFEIHYNLILGNKLRQVQFVLLLKFKFIIFKIRF